MQQLRRWFPSLLLGVILLPCSGLPLAAQQVVRLPDQDRALRAPARQVYAIGKEDGAAWESFSGIRQVAFDAQNNLYVLDGGSSSIYVFSPAGRFLRQIGRRGGGPGELTSPMRFAVTRDGQVVVSDMGRRAFSVFGTDGSFKRTFPFEERLGLLGIEQLVAHPRSGVVMTARPLPGGGGGQVGGVYRQVLDGRSAPVRLVATQEPPAISRQGQGGVGTISMARPAFSPTLRWGALPNGGLAVASTAAYEVGIVNPAGATTALVRRNLAPRRVTERDREAERARRAANMAEGRNVTVVGGSSPRVQAAVREALAGHMRNLAFADVIPVIQKVAVDGWGTLWVERAGRAAGEQGPIDLLTPAGRYLGTLVGQSMPDAFSASGRAAYIEKDEMEVERVVVRQLPRLTQ